jgi:UDP-glucose 4-epimerase
MKDLVNSIDLKKVLVIGGSGFLGSHVADALTDAGFKVCIFDKSPSMYLKENQQMIVGDILNPNDLDQAILGCFAVYNFAAIADIDEALNKPIDTVKINILGNIQILDSCKRNSIERYIYASTVYVNSREGGFYRCSKQAAEQYVEQYWHTYGLSYTILRYGSLYGPRSDQHNGLWRIVKNALDTGKLSYIGSPEAMRQYIHVVDAAKASVNALDKEFRNECVVLTGQEPMLVKDLLKMIAEILGISHNVEFIESKYEGHYIRTPYAYQPKIGRKYVPPLHVDLGQGLLELITELDNNK